MPYNEHIETRIKKIISSWKNTGHKNMFGGVCHLLNGNMLCGTYKDFLILRLGEENGNKALVSPYVSPFDITGKPMKRMGHGGAGWIPGRS
jgi:TfoX/Sxy family transcriptional regulator of competence genes